MNEIERVIEGLGEQRRALSKIIGDMPLCDMESAIKTLHLIIAKEQLSDVICKLTDLSKPVVNGIETA